MSALDNPRLMTEEEFLALPDDGMDRMLIKGILWEKPYMFRSPDNSAVLTSLLFHLHNWLQQKAKPRGRFLVDNAGFCLRKDPPTCVGIDVAFISSELAAAIPPNARLVQGVPILAAEIFSASTGMEEIAAKVEEYLDVGVDVVWLLNPYFHTVTVCRDGEAPETFNRAQELTSEPHLPGFKVAVAELFEDC